MKGKFTTIIILTFSLICILLTGCGSIDTLYESGIVAGDDHLLAYDFEPLTFYSFEELIDSIINVDVKNDMYNLSGITYYYAPTAPFTGITLDAITVKERYVCIYYYLKELDFAKYPSADEEEIARIANTVKLEWVRNADGEALLKNTIEQLSLKELGDGIYYYDISYPTQPDIVLSKSLFWVKDGYMFNLDVPPEVYESLYSQTGSLDIIIALEKIEIKK